MSDLTELVRLEEPAWYRSEPWDLYARLRDESPVFWYEPLNLWLLTRHEDIRAMGRDAKTFSSAQGLFLNDFRYGDVLAKFQPADAEVIMITDPPRHDELRREMRGPFGPRQVMHLEDMIRSVCRQLLDPIVDGEVVDWVDAVSIPLPLNVIALLIGFPLEDADLLREWSDIVIQMGAHMSGEELARTAAGLGPMIGYFEQHIADRQKNPGGDFLSTLVAAEAAGKISRSTVHSMLSTAMTAGNETARHTISGALIALATHPDQYRALVADRTLSTQATEEFLRWVTPVRGFGRTVVRETELRGQVMEVGQRVYSLYTSGNRDEAAFEEPQRFDITRRRDNVQLGFGFGQHMCIGAALARLQIRLLFEEVAARFAEIELVGEPTNTYETVFTNGWTGIPVRFHP